MNEILQKRIEKAVKKTVCPQCVFNDGGICNNDDDCKLFDDFVGLMTFALQNQWISVDEALPEKEGRYLCNYHYKFSNSEDECDCVDFGLFKDGKWYVANDEVTHWMPIPELKGGEE